MTSKAWFSYKSIQLIQTLKARLTQVWRHTLVCQEGTAQGIWRRLPMAVVQWTWVQRTRKWTKHSTWTIWRQSWCRTPAWRQDTCPRIPVCRQQTCWVISLGTTTRQHGANCLPPKNNFFWRRPRNPKVRVNRIVISARKSPWFSQILCPFQLVTQPARDQIPCSPLVNLIKWTLYSFGIQGRIQDFTTGGGGGLWQGGGGWMYVKPCMVRRRPTAPKAPPLDPPLGF